METTITNNRTSQVLTVAEFKNWINSSRDENSKMTGCKIQPFRNLDGSLDFYRVKGDASKVQLIDGQSIPVYKLRDQNGNYLADLSTQVAVLWHRNKVLAKKDDWREGHNFMIKLVPFGEDGWNRIMVFKDESELVDIDDL